MWQGYHVPSRAILLGQELHADVMTGAMRLSVHAWLIRLESSLPGPHNSTARVRCCSMSGRRGLDLWVSRCMHRPLPGVQQKQMRLKHALEKACLGQAVGSLGDGPHALQVVLRRGRPVVEVILLRASAAASASGCLEVGCLQLWGVQSCRLRTCIDKATLGYHTLLAEPAVRL